MAAKVTMAEGAALSAPSAGYVHLFPSGGHLYSMDSTGAVTLLGNLTAGSGLVSEGFNLHAQVGSGLYLQDDLIGADLQTLAGSGLITGAEALHIQAGSGLLVAGDSVNVQVGSGLYLQDDLVGFDTDFGDTRYALSGQGGGSGGAELTINSSGLMEVRELIFSSGLTAPESPITISDIDPIYDRIEIYMTLEAEGACSLGTGLLYYNGDTTASNYRFTKLENPGSLSLGENNKAFFANYSAQSSFGNDRANVRIEIDNPFDPNSNKSARVTSIYRQDATSMIHSTWAHNWENTDPITQIQIKHNGASDLYVSGCQFRVVGIRKRWVVKDGSYGDLNIADGFIVP